MTYATRSATERYRAVVRTPPATSIVRPERFKRYPDAARQPLPGAGLLAALFRAYAPVRLHYASVAGAAALLGGSTPPDPWGQELQMAGVRRTVPSGGALYPVELYAALPGCAGLPAGVYHYDARDHAAARIRTGDPRPELRRAGIAGPEPAGALLLAARPWKTAGKYGNLSYHIAALDLGVVLGQVLAQPPVPVRVSYYFLDDVLDRLLGIAPELESVFAAVLLRLEPAAGGGEPLGPPPAATGLDRDREYRSLVDPVVVELAAASRITDRSQLHRIPVAAPGAGSGSGPVRLPSPTPLPAGTLRRSSAVCFQPRPVRLDQLATVLAEATAGYPSDVGGTAGGDPPVGLYCVLSSVDGLPGGAYRYHPAGHALTRHWDLTESGPALRAAITGLDPRLVSASVSLFLVGRYRPAGTPAGERWYRVANLLAGVMLLRICRAAAGLGLGSRPNLGFHPEALASLLGLAPDQAPLVHVMIGHSAPRPGCLDLWLPPGEEEPR